MFGSSRSTTNVTNIDESINQDFGGASVGFVSQDRTDVTMGARSSVGGDMNIVSTDFGAVERAFDFGERSLEFAGEVAGDSFFFADRAGERAAMIQESAFGHVTSLAGTQADFMRRQTDKVADLAHSFQSGGQSDQLRMIGLVSGVALISVAMLAYAMRG